MRDMSRAQQRESYSEKAKQDLMILRLVHKVFCKSASLRLFRTIRIGFPMYRVPVCRGPKRLFELSQSQYCDDVREVMLSVKDCPFGSLPDFRLFLEDLAVLLPAALCRFRWLSSLSIEGLSASSNGTNAKWEPWPENLHQLFTSTTANVLHYVPLSGLKEPTIELPVTHDFTLLLPGTRSTPSRASIKTILQNIEHLKLSVCDASGLRGERYFEIPLSPT
jgi:hypothetical protein